LGGSLANAFQEGFKNEISKNIIIGSELCRFLAGKEYKEQCKIYRQLEKTIVLFAWGPARRWRIYLPWDEKNYTQRNLFKIK